MHNLGAVVSGPGKVNSTLSAGTYKGGIARAIDIVKIAVIVDTYKFESTPLEDVT
jgi:hypothetical protein